MTHAAQARIALLLTAIWPAAMSACAQEDDQDLLVLEDGRVEAHLEEKWLRIPAEVCIDRGEAYIEYFAFFNGADKAHESAFRVMCEPQSVNLCLLAMGLRTATDQVKSQGDPNTPRGDPVILEVEWREEGGRVHRRRSEEFLKEQGADRPMRFTQWIFTGGQYYEVDLPDGRTVHRWNGMHSRLFAAVYRDPEALINNPLDTGADDETYVIADGMMPPAGTAVTLIISVPMPYGAREVAAALRLLGREGPLAPAEGDWVERTLVQEEKLADRAYLVGLLEHVTEKDRAVVAAALKRVTGHDHGTDPAAWKKWLQGVEAPAGGQAPAPAR